MTIQQEDIERLHLELHELRTAVMQRRPGLAGQLQRLIEQTEQARRRAVGTSAEESVTAIADLLDTLQRSVDAQARLNDVAGQRQAG